MARLTRTQKYAELRNQLESDRETQLKTDDLSKYSDKLEQLSVNPLPDENREKELSKESLDRSLDDILKVMNDEVQEHLAKEEAIEDKEDHAVFDHAKEDVVSAEPIEESISGDEADKAFKDAKEDQNEDKKVKEDDEVQMIIDSLTSSLGKDDTSEKEIVEEKTEEVTTEENKEPKDEKNEPASEPKETISIEDLMRVNIDDNYLKDTLDEVKAYNKSIGSMTVDEVPKTILNEIRGINDTEETVDDDLSNTVTLEIKKILSELDEEESEEGSKSESVDEPKLEEITATDENEELKEIDTTEVKAVAVQSEPETTPEVPQELLIAEDETLKHIEPEDIVTADADLENVRRVVDSLPKDVGDLLRRYLENTQEDIYSEPKQEVKEEIKAEEVSENLGQTVEVKSVAMIDEEVQKVEDVKDDTDTKETALMNETMPLEVTGTSAYQKIQDEPQEEEGGSKILNIILIVLIVILVLVLIVVAYLILVAQGIIPSLF